MSVIHVDIVSATEEIYSGDANCVFAPATMGEIGVYPQHVPLISTLKPGEVRVETENGVESIYVSGGIVEVQPHTVTIFSDTAIRANAHPFVKKHALLITENRGGNGAVREVCDCLLKAHSKYDDLIKSYL